MIRLATLKDLDEVARLYRDTITVINIQDYTRKQVEAWAGRWTNTPGWANKITTQHFVVEEMDGVITGFSSLTTDGHVDMFFVHHEYQGKGIGKRLIAYLEKEANDRNYTQMTTDASLTARPFFERMGFAVVMPQTLMVDGVELTNYKMKKSL